MTEVSAETEARLLRRLWAAGCGTGAPPPSTAVSPSVPVSTGTAAGMSRVSLDALPTHLGSGWELLGFQRFDCAPDFRSMGRLGLLALVAFWEERPGWVRMHQARVHLPSRGFPLSAALLSVLHWCLQAVGGHGKRGSMGGTGTGTGTKIGSRSGSGYWWDNACSCVTARKSSSPCVPRLDDLFQDISLLKKLGTSLPVKGPFDGCSETTFGVRNLDPVRHLIPSTRLVGLVRATLGHVEGAEGTGGGLDRGLGAKGAMVSPAFPSVDVPGPLDRSRAGSAVEDSSGCRLGNGVSAGGSPRVVPVQIDGEEDEEDEDMQELFGPADQRPSLSRGGSHRQAVGEDRSRGQAGGCVGVGDIDGDHVYSNASAGDGLQLRRRR